MPAGFTRRRPPSGRSAFGVHCAAAAGLVLLSAAATAQTERHVGNGPTPCASAMGAVSNDATIAERIADADPTSRRQLRELMEAARILGEFGRDADCRRIVAAVVDLAAGPVADRDGAGDGEPSARRAPSGGGDAGGNTRLARSSATDDWTWRRYDYGASAARAEPFSEVAGRVSSEMIVGAEARMEAGEGLGSVKGFLTDRVGVSHLIVGYGGLLGIGDREVAVPVDQVSFDPVSGAFFVEAGPAWFEHQPDWDRADWSDQPDAWLRDE